MRPPECAGGLLAEAYQDWQEPPAKVVLGILLRTVVLLYAPVECTPHARTSLPELITSSGQLNVPAY